MLDKDDVLSDLVVVTIVTDEFISKVDHVHGTIDQMVSLQIRSEARSSLTVVSLIRKLLREGEFNTNKHVTNVLCYYIKRGSCSCKYDAF